MDEVKRFVRYVIPGIVFIILVFLFFYLSDTTMVINLLKSEAMKNTIGLVLAVFLGSGGLGFILANIYHTIYWTLNRLAINHLPLFRETPPGFRSIDIEGNPISNLTRREAWTIITQYCHSEIKKDSGKDIEGMCLITDRLVDITHGLGAALVATFLSFPTWYLLRSLKSTQNICDIPGRTLSTIIIIWIVLMIVLIIGHYRTNRALEEIANSTLARRLRRKQSSLIDICFIRRR